MREIKFRVFFYNGIDKGTGEYFDAGYCISENFIIFDDFNLKPTDECSIIEQFTGLKDKNGVDIYEGDIYTNGILNYIVSFINGAFCGGLINSNVSPLGFSCEFDTYTSMFTGEIESIDYHNRIEVIGNIHQNPELLK